MEMKKVILSLILFLIFSVAEAQQLNKQQLDSLFYTAVKIRMPELLPGLNQTSKSDTLPLKSATGLFNAIKMNLEYFNGGQGKILKKILERPTADTSFVTPESFFRVHFIRSGYDKPTYDLQQLAESLDSVYSFEVNYFGYPPPPPDNGTGGDDKYDVYILNTGGSTYGYTVPETEISPGSKRYTAYTVISSDFTGYYTTGIDAARVTAAHEFAHAIHIGNYINRFFEGDEFFYELSATAMEHFVFNTIKDYIQYLPAYFNNTQIGFGVNGTISEFALGIWNIFMADQFGYGIIKRQWELMPEMRALKAIENSILENGSTFRKEFGSFGKWLFYTNYRTVTGNYFEDAELYPLVHPLSVLTIQNSPTTVNVNAFPVTQNFIEFVYPDKSDTIYSDISNSDIINGIENKGNTNTFTFSLSDSPLNGYNKLTNDYYTKLEAGNLALWNELDIINNAVVREDTTVEATTDIPLSYAYPDPFVYDNYSANVINIPVKVPVFSKVNLNVYSPSMNLIYNGSLTVTFGRNNSTVINWNLNDIGKKLPSGVYIYITEDNGEKTIGKMVIINK
jgi:hypothetical protein